MGTCDFLCSSFDAYSADIFYVIAFVKLITQVFHLRCHRCSLVTELEGEIKRTKKEIAVKFDELEHVIEKGKKLENEKLLGGEYRQKLSKFRLFNKRQTEVSDYNL